LWKLVTLVCRNVTNLLSRPSTVSDCEIHKWNFTRKLNKIQIFISNKYMWSNWKIIGQTEKNMKYDSVSKLTCQVTELKQSFPNLFHRRSRTCSKHAMDQQKSTNSSDVKAGQAFCTYKNNTQNYIKQNIINTHISAQSSNDKSTFDIQHHQQQQRFTVSCGSRSSTAWNSSCPSYNYNHNNWIYTVISSDDIQLTLHTDWIQVEIMRKYPRYKYCK